MIKSFGDPETEKIWRRIQFKFKNNEATDVSIVDYHK